MEKIDVIVVGAGVVGLAVARALALSGREVVVLEQHQSFGTETSSRNSEVIHAGLHYRPGGKRAEFCVAGKKLLYDYCAERHIPHERCEKLIVAQNAEEAGRLDDLIKTAQANGVNDLEKLTGSEARTLEPELQCVAAVLSPSSGIIDSHGLMLALVGDIENTNGAIAYASPLLSGSIENDCVGLCVGGQDPIELNANLVVNCAGLYADRVAMAIEGLDQNTIPKIRPAKGQYFTYSGPAPFQRLIYPLHTNDSLGVHYSRDIGGGVRFGPDITWDVSFGDYSVDEEKRTSFFLDVRKFWPKIEESRLSPGYAGLRPKLSAPGIEGDFQIKKSLNANGIGYIGLYGIESPGLTSCLAIGGHIAAMAGAS